VDRALLITPDAAVPETARFPFVRQILARFIGFADGAMTRGPEVQFLDAAEVLPRRWHRLSYVMIPP
jgi:hypothetical protein